MSVRSVSIRHSLLALKISAVVVAVTLAEPVTTRRLPGRLHRPGALPSRDHGGRGRRAADWRLGPIARERGADLAAGNGATELANFCCRAPGGVRGTGAGLHTGI